MNTSQISVGKTSSKTKFFLPIFPGISGWAPKKIPNQLEWPFSSSYTVASNMGKSKYGTRQFLFDYSFVIISNLAYYQRAETFFLARILRALVSSSLMRLDTKLIVFWKEASLLRLKSIPGSVFRFRFNPTICWSVGSSVTSPCLGVSSSCEEKEADESLDLLCSDSSLCFWCLMWITMSSSSVSFNCPLSRAICSWLDSLFS